ncbi:hypothetical protein CWC28_07270 [Pseudoalteromonas sp. S4492]|nr:hypothetical protein CWC28_07270 [Pseudoalteromonas sp. S4492]
MLYIVKERFQLYGRETFVSQGLCILRKPLFLSTLNFEKSLFFQNSVLLDSTNSSFCFFVSSPPCRWMRIIGMRRINASTFLRKL